MNTPNMSGNADSFRFCNDSTLKPTLMVAKNGNFFVPITTIASGSTNAIPVFSVNGGGGGGSVNQVGITGTDGSPVKVTGNAMRVFVDNQISVVSGNIVITSGNIHITDPVIPISGNIVISSGFISVDAVGISGVSGVALDILNSGGFKSALVLSQGLRASGFTGVPFPTVGGTIVKSNVSGIYPDNTVQPFLSDQFGNMFISLATSLSHLIDSMSTRPVAPLTKGVYGLSLTGVGVFDSYSGITPLIIGNVVSLSIEPDSSNTDKVFYSFSGTATTGQAWELRGERTFEISSNREVFIAQASSGQRVMFHFQTF